MPEIEVSQDSFVYVTIHNEAEYRAFVNCLEEYVDCYSLTLASHSASPSRFNSSFLSASHVITILLQSVLCSSSFAGSTPLYQLLKWIKDRESYGEKYFDILEVPVENIEISWLDGRRVRLDDVNFDGYRDLIFVGDNDLMGGYRTVSSILLNKNQIPENTPILALCRSHTSYQWMECHCTEIFRQAWYWEEKDYIYLLFFRCWWRLPESASSITSSVTIPFSSYVM